MAAPQTPPQKPPQKPGLNHDPKMDFDWRALLWFTAIAFVLLWLWQDFVGPGKARTIAYSEFQRYVAAGAVTECQIYEDKITGTIDASKVANESSPDGERIDDAPPSDATALPGTTTTDGTKTSDAKTSDAKTSDAKTSDAKTSDASAKDAAKSPEASDGSRFQFTTIRIEDPQLVEALQAGGTEFVGVRPGFLTDALIYWVLPIALLLFVWNILSRRLPAAGRGVMSIGKSHAKLVADRETGVTFEDVAGCDEAKFELQEVVDFLQNPKKYTMLGAKIPKGVLLVGPPGTGKTLLARAVAGQAKVPFFSLSGSDFVEMFVGVGAARVRDLFRQASEHAPCIVFIDELDAIGRKRGVHVAAVNDERESTLNQLLVEMDGFEANIGVILLSATNRPDVLDAALLRPGRFDRQVVLDAPDLAGRTAILTVHARNKPIDDSVDLQKVARATPGFSGADLANVMNEAALLSARVGSKTISQKQIEEAVEKVIAGPERKSRRLEPDERERVAFHEVGHALVGALSEHADPVKKISIIPRGKAALGYTLHLPTGEQMLMTRGELVDRLKGLLGGRAAEEVKYGEISTGAENDLERATIMARQMVCMYGMSDKVGLVHCAHRDGTLFLDPEANAQLDCSDSTADLIDQEVKLLLDLAYQDAKKLLSDHRTKLDRIAEALLQRETLDADAFNALLQERAA